MPFGAPPVIIKGQKLSFTKRPFLGGKRVNFLIALYNAMTNLKVKVVSQVPSASSSTGLSNITPDFSFDGNGQGVLTIPFTTPPSQPGWFWIKGARNYDPTQSYKEQQLVYVQSTSSVATTGVTDPDSGVVVKSLPGIWVAVQDVAPLSGPAYHIPHLPMPTPDDMDATNNYWAFVSPMDSCL